MKTLFVCLANSKKYNERCIAGIKLEKSSSGTYVPTTPLKWIRPVTDTKCGQVPSRLVNKMDVLDIVELEIKEEVPNGYQSENVLFYENSLRMIEKGGYKANDLDRLLNHDSLLFGNSGKAVPKDKINKLAYSLILIKASEPKFEFKKTPKDTQQLRGKFTYDNNPYDLPVTDVKFEEAFKQDQNLLDRSSELYLTISLAIEHNNWHSKLIAGVIRVPQKKSLD